MSFGIRRTRVASGEVSSDSYGFLTCRVMIRFPRLASSIPEVEESSDPGRFFQISKGLLILAIEMLGQSRLLIAKGFIRRLGSFRAHLYIKG